MVQDEANALKLESPEAYERLSFEEIYEGYVIDLVRKLAEKLKFKYKFHIVNDKNYGSYDEEKKTWNGMIRELQDQVDYMFWGLLERSSCTARMFQKADMAVIDLSITSIRQQAIDFTMPYMSTGRHTSR